MLRIEDWTPNFGSDLNVRPRSGEQNTETTKYCRQCGLPIAQISGYVATGGTRTLAQPSGHSAPPPFQFTETSAMLALKQKRILTILSICIAPIILAILADEVFRAGDLNGITFLLAPLGIAWATFRYKTQLRSNGCRHFKSAKRLVWQCSHPNLASLGLKRLHKFIMQLCGSSGPIVKAQSEYLELAKKSAGNLTT